MIIQTPAKRYSRSLAKAGSVDYNAHREQALERLADTLEAHLDIDAILALVKS
ncbi:hypothetical protein HAALTHF_42030n [Vreelandella aquamarina]|nr:hypothetical protein HAALTHF_42030n [Halomonas axialensis]